LDTDGVSVWIRKQLKPHSKSFESFPPEAFAWTSLALSAGAGALLYFAQPQYYPLAALPAVLLLLMRLLSDSFEELLVPSEAKDRNSAILMSGLCARLADLSMFLGFAFWDSLRIHLVLLGIVSMLFVSYVGELGRSVGAEDSLGGLLCKSNRVILLTFFCTVYLLKPNAWINDFSVFEVMFALFIPLASITLLQRMDRAISHIRKK
jgi:hypothetical protein